MNNGLHEISTCEVCMNKELEPVLDLGLHPMCDDLVPVGDDRVCPSINRHFVLQAMPYRTPAFSGAEARVVSYELSLSFRFTADVLKGMEALVASCAERFGDLVGKRVLDIGCNDGSLLDFFRQQGSETIGIEPTGAYLDSIAKSHDTYKNYVSEDVARRVVKEHGKPDFITFTNVFAHIEDLQGLLASIKVLMGPTTVLVIENHYLGAVLEKNQFDTFYQEHPRTYSYTSFVHMAKSLGMGILRCRVSVALRGNIRIYIGATGLCEGAATSISMPLTAKSHFISISS